MPSSFWEMLKSLYAVDTLQGYTEEEIESLKELFGALPQVLEEYYRTAGRTKAFRQVQDSWMLPEDFQKWEWLQKSDHMILLNENQSVCRAGIRRGDLCQPDPPVYTTEDDEHWVLSASSVSEFLPAALLYESVYTLEYSPEEFYWVTEEEVEQISARLQKLPFEMANWVSGMTITFYSNEPDHLVVIMDCGDEDSDMLYGATSETAYKKLMAVLEGIGEPL